MDLTETLTFEPQSKPHESNLGAADPLVSVKYEPHRGTEVPDFNLDANHRANPKSKINANIRPSLKVIGAHPNDRESESESDFDSCEILTREFLESQLVESAIDDSSLEFESFDPDLKDEALLDKECFKAGSNCEGICDKHVHGKQIDSKVGDHAVGDDEPTVLFGSDTIPFVSDGLEGKLLDHYLLKDRIGSGGMARVYLADDTLLQRNVAIKVIQNRKYVTDEQMANSLMVEAVAQAQLNHPNIVSVFYVGKTEGMPFLAMEHVDGQSLEQRLSNGPMPASEAVAYCFQIINALQHAESHDVVHGDIKPANLLIDRSNKIKLSDFGLARQVNEDGSQVKKLVGTPSHMAPELFEKLPVDKQTDLYALGVTLFQMIFNRHPYELAGETAEEVKLALDAAKLRIPEMWPEEVPISLRMTLTKLLEKDPSNRYRSLAELKADLEREFGPTQAPARTGLRCLAMGIDSAVYALMSIPFCLQIATIENATIGNVAIGNVAIGNAVNNAMGNWQLGLSRLASSASLLFLPFLYLICTALLRRTIGQWATQTKTVRDQTLTISIPLFFRREMARTVSIWYALVPASIAMACLAPPIWIATSVACGSVIAIARVCGVGSNATLKSALDERFETSEIMLG